MKPKHVRFGNIVLLDRLIERVKKSACFVGYDENNEAVFDFTIPLPTIKFTGTVKAHGSNCSVCMRGDTMWYQSKSNILERDAPHYDFYDFAEKRKEAFKKIIKKVVRTYEINPDTHTVAIYGEYAGKNINKGTAITKLSRRFVVFAIKIVPDGDEPLTKYTYLQNNDMIDHDNDIYCVSEFGNYKIEIDFNDTSKATEIINSMVNSIDEKCPIADKFGIEGSGEGIVWVSQEKYKGNTLCFKSKSDKFKHRQRERAVCPYDSEKEKTINEFVDEALHKGRLDQAMEEVFYAKNITPTVEMISEFVKWVMKDVAKEEYYKLPSIGLLPKDVGKICGKRAAQYILFGNYK